MWAQFQRGLPDGVSVRAWQKRTDVLRAMIVGPEGTPYEGALFAFDLALPATYPAQPPTVHYLTQGIGERLNPNLYENGKVCLSLLGTWSGPRWDPSSSTILQLLVSIQGLILVDKPYYNEPGHEKQAGSAEGEQHAQRYNENTRLLALQALVNIAKRPPKGLREPVRAHLRARGAGIVASVERIIAGDAKPDGDAKPPPAAPAGDAPAAEAVEYSEGFRSVLKRLLPRLRVACLGRKAAAAATAADAR